MYLQGDKDVSSCKQHQPVRRPCDGGALALCGLMGSMVVGLAWGQTQSAPRAQTPTEVLRNIQHSSDELEQLRAQLQSPNPSVRATAFNAMVESNNATLVTIAINEGHASADAVLRDLSARAAFRQLLSFKVEPSGDVSAQQDDYLFFVNGGLQTKLSKYDPAAGLFILPSGEGQISGNRLTFRSGYCQGSLAALEGSWTYEGPVTCIFNKTKLVTRMHINIR